MTAETLKPFITPQNVENCPTTLSSAVVTRRQKKNFNCLDICLTTLTVLLLAVLLGITIWLAIRVDKSEIEISRLNDVIERMQKRLGMNYLEDAEKFENDYRNAIIDDPNADTDYEDGGRSDDDDDYDNFDTYEEMQEFVDSRINKYDKEKSENYEDNDDEDDEEDDEDVDEVPDNGPDGNNSADDDSLYEAFEKYNKSRKTNHGTRMTRSIIPELQLQNKTKVAELIKSTSVPRDNEKTEHKTQLGTISNDSKRGIVAERLENKHKSPLRPRSHRRRKVPIVKSGDSLISAKYTTGLVQPKTPIENMRPAAHFHLNRKVPERHAAIRVDSFPGDMYIGHHPSWSNEVGTEHYFSVENGVLTVREPGLYYVYAQICYNNTHDQNGFVIFHGHKPFLQCLNTVPTNLPLKIHTCHTSGLIFLQQDETLHLRDFHSDRNVILKDSNNRSYFGLIKV